jgi:hypothetical protein
MSSKWPRGNIHILLTPAVKETYDGKGSCNFLGRSGHFDGSIQDLMVAGLPLQDGYSPSFATCPTL